MLPDSWGENGNGLGLDSKHKSTKGEIMGEAIAASFIEATVSALVGGFIGYFSAVRNVPRADRPSSGQWFATLAIAAFGGAALTVIFELAMLAALPKTDVSKMQEGVALVLGIGLGFMDTQRKLKNGR